MEIQDPQEGIITSQLAPVAEQEAAPAVPVVAPPSDEYKAPEVQPITTQVDSATETVESRLNDMTAKGSTYTNLAKKDAQRSANSRGLINSTMAGAAGTEAAIRAALPVAQQDAKTYADTRILNQNTENEFLKNRQSANLNMETASHTSQLAQLEGQLEGDIKLNFEKVMQDEKFSDEAKLQMITTMNDIMAATNDQITTIGTSDRSASQQEAAIDMIIKSRDAELAVYQDLLAQFDDWEWGTDFTPKSDAGANTGTSTVGGSLYQQPVSVDPVEPPSGTSVGTSDGRYPTPATQAWIDMYLARGGMELESSDGLWRWDKNANVWIPT